MITTVLHWDQFNHDHVSFWAWLLRYASTPVLLPVLWVKNRRIDPGNPATVDTTIPGGLRIAAGLGGALQLALALVMFVSPDLAADAWAWPLEPATSRSISAFLAFPAVTWLWFLFDSRWSSFRITEQTATLGLVLIGIGAVRARGDFRTDTWFVLYMVGLVVALVLNITLHISMDRRAKRMGIRLHHRSPSWRDQSPAASQGPVPAGRANPATGRALAVRRTTRGPIAPSREWES